MALSRPTMSPYLENRLSALLSYEETLARMQDFMHKASTSYGCGCHSAQPFQLCRISDRTSYLQYADRQPIGLEKVIKGVTAERVQEFYHRWYRPENMAIVAVGDFPNTEVGL